MHDHIAERLLLGCIALDPRLMVLFAQRHVREDFEFKHGLLWDSFMQAFLDKREPTIDSVRMSLQGRMLASGKTAYDAIGEDLIEAVFDPVKLREQGVTNTAKAQDFSDRISDAADRAARSELCDIFKEGAERAGIDPDEFWGNVITKIVEHRKRKDRQGVRHVYEFWQDISEDIDAWFTGKSGSLLSTGYPTLDDGLGGGIGKKRLIILGGAPGSGKTTLLLNLLATMAAKNIPVGMSSLEMAGGDLLTMLACRNSGMSYKGLRNGDYTTVPYPGMSNDLLERNRACKGRFDAALKNLSAWPLLIDDRAEGMNAGRIYASVMLASAFRENPIRLWGIDFAELVASSDSRSETQRVFGIFRAAKNLARLLDTTVILLSQVTKEVEKRPLKKPTVADLRYGDHAAADNVLLMWDIWKYTQTGDLNINLLRSEYSKLGITGGADELIVIMAKSRYGPTGIMKFAYDRAMSMIRDINPNLAPMWAMDYNEPAKKQSSAAF